MIKLIYRQKIFLALIEIFHTRLEHIELMKLLFLFCKQNNLKYYSFFPHLYGCFSFEVYKDACSLTKKGLIADTKQYFLEKQTDIFSTLELKDRQMLHRFHQTFGYLRGDDLIRKTYLEYPEYTKRSKIKEKILTPQEILALNIPDTLPLFERKPSIFTIGYEGISIDEYLRRLIKNDISIVVDVRKNPQSMKFDFNRKALADFLDKGGIKYKGIPDLGIPSEMRSHLNTFASYQKLFAIYESEILPHQTCHISEIAEMVKNGERVALTCFEKDARFCHRLKIAQKLYMDYNFEVVNL